MSLIFFTWRLLFYLSLLLLFFHVSIFCVFLYFIYVAIVISKIIKIGNLYTGDSFIYCCCRLSSFFLIYNKKYSFKAITLFVFFSVPQSQFLVFHTQPATIIVMIIIIKNQKYCKIKDLWFQCNFISFLPPSSETFEF